MRFCFARFMTPSTEWDYTYLTRTLSACEVRIRNIRGCAGTPSCFICNSHIIRSELSSVKLDRTSGKSRYTLARQFCDQTRYVCWESLLEFKVCDQTNLVAANDYRSAPNVITLFKEIMYRVVSPTKFPATVGPLRVQYVKQAHLYIPLSIASNDQFDVSIFGITFFLLLFFFVDFQLHLFAAVICRRCGVLC